MKKILIALHLIEKKPSPIIRRVRLVSYDKIFENEYPTLARKK